MSLESRSRRRRSAFGVAVLALAACAPLPEETAATRSDPLLLRGATPWVSQRQAEADPERVTEALYARAVGHFQTGPWATSQLCSGALVGHDLFVTAAHCKEDARDHMFLSLGYYGPNPGDRAAAVAQARLRLLQLGLPYSNMLALNDGALTSAGVCNFVGTDGTRDVAFWRCGSLSSQIYLDDGTLHRVFIPPGDLWGRLSVLAGSRPAGRSLYGLSVNRGCGDELLNIRVSTGSITRASASCIAGSTNCFDLDADAMAGSSGGPVLDRATHSMFGVFHAEDLASSGIFESNGNPNNPCDRERGTNTGAYLSGTLPELFPPPQGPYAPVGSAAGITPYVGGTGGSLLTLSCPSGTLARGLVGSTSAQGLVGNLGVVCVPVVASRTLLRATVHAGGSIDTTLGATRNLDFERYRRERRSSTAPAPGEQVLALCPAEMFLTGVRLRAGALVDRITAIDCATTTSSATLTLAVGPGGSIGTSLGGTARILSCPAGAFWDGLRLRSAWSTDGVQGLCRRVE